MVATRHQRYEQERSENEVLNSRDRGPADTHRTAYTGEVRTCQLHRARVSLRGDLVTRDVASKGTPARFAVTLARGRSHSSDHNGYDLACDLACQRLRACA